ncbi:hypothetical protein [Xanthomonas axonopodis]|uniref:hypothetical protein n=1 Tax=Xanthomonas axonopodis TaxID=53413 RepID=UPI001F14E876|nr:hypothetical protein [Xanthomonas axonopodis]
MPAVGPRRLQLPPFQTAERMIERQQTVLTASAVVHIASTRAGQRWTAWVTGIVGRDTPSAAKLQALSQSLAGELCYDALSGRHRLLSRVERRTAPAARRQGNAAVPAGARARPQRTDG